MKALGHPGRCGLLRERSRLARLRPVDAIRRGALSGARALWSSGSESNSPPSCGVLNEAGLGHGLGSPLRCQRVNVKFMRQHAVRVAGPDRIIFCSSSAIQKINHREHRVPQRKIHRGTTKPATASLCVFSLCFLVLSGGRLLASAGSPSEQKIRPQIVLTFAFYSDILFWGSQGRLSPH